jgi:hypothetical protein
LSGAHDGFSPAANDGLYRIKEAANITPNHGEMELNSPRKSQGCHLGADFGAGRSGIKSPSPRALHASSSFPDDKAKQHWRHNGSRKHLKNERGPP